MLFLTKKREDELIEKMIAAMGKSASCPTKEVEAKAEAQTSLSLVAGLKCAHCGSKDYKYQSVCNGVTRYTCDSCKRTFQAEYIKQAKHGLGGGLLVSAGHHSNVVKYKSRFLLYLGDKRSDILLQTKDKSVAMSAMRAVERCVQTLQYGA